MLKTEPIGSLVCLDKTSLNGDISEIGEEVILSLSSKKPTLASSKVSGSSSKDSGIKQKKKQKKVAKNMSRKQKLLRRRAEVQRDHDLKNDLDEDDEDRRDVKVKYSIVYFNWAVSDDEEDIDDENESSEEAEEMVKNVTLPLRQLKLQK